MQTLGKYEIIEEVGRGGFAVVYKAHDTALDRIVALKVIHNAPTQETDFVQRFRQEARAAASLGHPNIVPVYDFGDADGTLYLAMALIGEGRTLRNLLAEGSPLSLQQALPILTQLADALDYLHGRGPPLIHRDLKPTNVLLEGEGDKLWVVLTDFGLVRSLEASTELTKSGTILGTPAYMAPEQADPKQWGEITPLTDVYALGVITYEMLIGQQPFTGDWATVFHAHAYEVPSSPLEIIPNLDDDLAKVLTRALVKSPARRYPSAGALVKALREVAQAQVLQERQEVELVHLLAQAQAACEIGDWLAVQDACVRVMQIERTHPKALEMMAEATTGLQRESAEEAARRQRALQYEAGEQALAAGQWQAAITAFEEIAEGNPDFREVQKKLPLARDELECAQWYDKAIVHGEAGRWAEACRTWVSLLRRRMNYRDGDATFRLLDAVDNLLGQLDKVRQTFKRQQRDLTQTRKALALYDALAAAVEVRDWERAGTVGRELLAIVPDLKHTRAWLARAQLEVEPTKRLEDDRTKYAAQELKALFSAIPEIDGLAIVEVDGVLRLGLLPREVDQDRLVALSAAQLSLTERSAYELSRGHPQESYVLGSQGSMILIVLDSESALVALVRKDVEPVEILDAINREIETWSTRSRSQIP
jgi:predicted regulator of Ras-like GTPase activity (Roadblock/LC7/MglB family)